MGRWDSIVEPISGCNIPKEQVYRILSVAGEETKRAQGADARLCPAEGHRYDVQRKMEPRLKVHRGGLTGRS